jgi:hypothetical protein
VFEETGWATVQAARRRVRRAGRDLNDFMRASKWGWIVRDSTNDCETATGLCPLGIHRAAIPRTTGGHNARPYIWVIVWRRHIWRLYKNKRR